MDALPAGYIGVRRCYFYCGVLPALVYREKNARESHGAGFTFIRRDQCWGDRNPAYYLAKYEYTTHPGNRTALATCIGAPGALFVYAIMILMPLTGYLGTGRAADFFFLFQVPKFEDTWLFNTFVWQYLGLTFEEFEAPIDFFHKEIMGAWLVWMLIVGHAGAALYHHFVLKDRTLIKMSKG